MSKFFNETQKAHQWAQQRLVNQDLDVRQILESLKQGPAINASVAEARFAHGRQVTLGNGNATRLVLRQDDSLDAALEAYRGLRNKLMRAQSKSGLRSIVITSSLPGEGKTLTTMNLGLCYAQLPQQRVLVTGTRWQEFLGHCGEMFKVILIDTPPILPLADFELISAACDGIVMVVRAHHGQRKALQKTASTLDTKKLVGVVFNATVVNVKDDDVYG